MNLIHHSYFTPLLRTLIPLSSSLQMNFLNFLKVLKSLLSDSSQCRRFLHLRSLSPSNSQHKPPHKQESVTVTHQNILTYGNPPHTSSTKCQAKRTCGTGISLSQSHQYDDDFSFKTVTQLLRRFSCNVWTLSCIQLSSTMYEWQSATINNNVSKLI